MDFLLICVCVAVGEILEERKQKGKDIDEIAKNEAKELGYKSTKHLKQK